MILFFPIFIIFSSFAFNQEELGNRFHFGVGLDLFQTLHKNQRYEFGKYKAFKNPIDNAISRIAWNVSYRVTKEYPFYVGFRTNRGINFSIEEIAYDTVVNQKVTINIKSEADSLYFATAIHKKVLPFIIATRMQNKSTVHYSNGVSFVTKGVTAMYGLGMATPLSNRGTASVSYYFPNKDFKTNGMFGFSINYFLI